ncbi:MAG: LacI family DNA-binding transcriptional regulator [Alkalispirochaeta sp.]
MSTTDGNEEMGRQGPATVKDIARRALVSVGTVDRVLHSRGRVSAATAERVWDAVKQLNYSPNLVARNLSRAQRQVFGILMPAAEQDSGYWQITISGIEAALSELAHHYVAVEYFHFNRTDSDSFRKSAEQLLAAELDGVLLAPTLYEVSREFISKLANTPCVVFDGEVPNSNVLSTINQDSFESGLLAGKLAQMLDPEGPYVTVTIGSADYHLRRRREGFVRFFELAGNGHIDHFELDQIGGEAQLRASLRRMREQPGSVFVTNALAHLVARELNDSAAVHTPIIGYDLIPENAACLRTGLMDFVINQEPRRQGYNSLYALYRHVVLREAVEPRIRMPIDLVMRENLDFHLNLGTRERVAL